MKHVKITFAEGISICAGWVVMLGMVMLGVVWAITGTWDTPPVFWDVIFLFTFLCGGCLLAFLVAAMTARQFARAGLLGVLCSVYAMAFYQGWIQDANSRLLLLVLLLVSVCIGTILVRYKPFPKRGAVQRVIVIFAIVMGLPVAIGAAISLSPPYRPDIIKHSITSPDGRYQAALITRDRDDDYAGYDVVTIKPTYFSVFHLLDYPNREIAEMVDGESLTGVRWANQHTLVVGYYSGTTFAQQDKSWWDVKIVYKK